MNNCENTPRRKNLTEEYLKAEEEYCTIELVQFRSAYSWYEMAEINLEEARASILKKREAFKKVWEDSHKARKEVIQ